MRVYRLWIRLLSRPHAGHATAGRRPTAATTTSSGVITSRSSRNSAGAGHSEPASIAHLHRHHSPNANRRRPQVASPGTRQFQDHASANTPEFAPAIRQAAALLTLDTTLADAAYDAEHNHRLCRDGLGIRRTVIALTRRNTGRRWPATPYRRAMKRHFPRQLYHQRWQAESTFSRHKRRLGSALRARRTTSQHREIVLRILTHNLMLLKRDRQRFSTEQKGFKEAWSDTGLPQLDAVSR
jgi:transposase